MPAQSKELLLRVSLYYAALAGAVVAIATWEPNFLKVLPFGGLEHWKTAPDAVPDTIDLDKIKLYHRPIHLFADSIKLATSMLGVVLIVIPIRWVYLSLAPTHRHNHGMAASLMLLPLVVTAIIQIVEFSLPLAFALTGIFAGVRYRTTLKQIEDAFFTFATIAVGLAAGTRSLGIGFALAVTFSICALFLLPPSSPELDDD